VASLWPRQPRARLAIMFFMQARGAVMMIPPPLFYVAAFALGLLVERWAPAPTRFVFAEGAVIARPLLIVAGTSILLGVVLGPLNKRLTCGAILHGSRHERGSRMRN
jgi:hypothetical protein